MSSFEILTYFPNLKNCIKFIGAWAPLELEATWGNIHEQVEWDSLCRVPNFAAQNNEIIINPCALYVGYNAVYFVFCRSFQGHTGSVEHVSFDGNAIISASTDL